MMSATAPSTQSPPLKPVLTPALRRLLWGVLLLFGLLVLDSVYLVAVTVAEALTGRVLQNEAYLSLFLLHLALGLLLVVPALLFGVLHFRRARRRPNRYAVRAGMALFGTLVALLLSGVLLTRFGVFEINDPRLRDLFYWIHVLTPLAVVWLFVLHRLAGPALRWRLGGGWGLAAAASAVVGAGLHLAADGATGPLGRDFAPALVQAPAVGAESGASIPPEHLMQDAVCAECHADIAARHAGSVHRLSSFNNPAYRFSIEDTRAIVAARDGGVEVTRLCAACHDQVPLLSGRFDDADYDPDTDPAASVGITCLGCHAVTAVNSPRGNGDYRLEDPPRYPFAFSDNAFLKAVNRQLIKAKPEFHKHSLLKPLHREPGFCGACHKVHLPEPLNHYRWLRGQNHYDSFRMSGVSGHRVDSFYYPERAETGCTGCHMEPRASDDPAARPLPDVDGLAVHDHLFAAANTAVPAMVGRPAEENAERVAMMRRAARVDIFGLKDDGRIDGQLYAPLRPAIPRLRPGGRYLLEVVVRTVGIGHHLTQGTADSNEVWLDLNLRDGERVIGRSGDLAADGAVDDWAWFGNAYLLDRDGNRIERRNAQDIVVPLYDHQIPPGAAAVVHYAFRVPDDVQGPIQVDAALRYRKFDSRFYRHVQARGGDGEPFRNDLPITTLAEDALLLPVGDQAVDVPEREVQAWERWNDYGIGLLREGKRGESRQAEAAFRVVDQLGRADGPMNLTRVLYREGRLDEAAAVLERARELEAPPWVLAWYTGLIARDLGELDAAIEALETLAETRFNAARDRGFDFSQDERMLIELARTLYERARQERGESRRQAREALLAQARDRLAQALAIDPESDAAHHNMALVLGELGEADAAARHRALHERYRPDDNIVERAVTLHRSRNPAADHAAEAVAIYDLQRDSEVPARPGAEAMTARAED
jgi:tetratricopeptide (TPR) repeat protein